MNISSKFTLALIILFFANAFNDAFAASVAAVKGKQVLVVGSNLEKNALYYVVQDGKKKGIIKIVNVKGQKAIASLLKGSALKGATLVARPAKAKSSSQAASSEKSSSSKKSESETSYDSYSSKSSSGSSDSYKSSTKKFRGGGLMLSYQMNKASVDFQLTGTESLSGTSIGFRAFGDYEIYNNLFLRAEFGTMPFNAEGCGGTCVMAINYLGGTLWARYMFGTPEAKTRIWAGANGSLVFPLGTGDTNAVDTDNVGSTLTFGVGAGLDYKLNDKYYIPVTLEYTLFPPNDEVSASLIQLKAGLGMRF